MASASSELELLERAGSAKFLERAVYNTVRFFDVLDMPITITQIWFSLIIDRASGSTRWGGFSHSSLKELEDLVHTSKELARVLHMQSGYVSLRDRAHLIPERLTRHARSQQKWKHARRLMAFLSMAPFVRALAGSGSLAIDNTKESSDFDVFVIVAAKRIWTCRLALLILSHVTGRRRRYWDQQAPNKLCLNHYISEDNLVMKQEIRNIYTAVAYHNLVPVFGRDFLGVFHTANASWVRSYIMVPDERSIRHTYEVRIWKPIDGMKRIIEQFLIEPVGEYIEMYAERLQRWFISRHSESIRSGRVSLSAAELAFHPDTKVPSILSRYYQDPRQRSLL